jgi:hypothetical protein
MKKLTAALGTAIVLGALSLASPAVAADTATVAPDAPASAPAYDPMVPAPGPNDLTWSEVAAVKNAPSSYSDTKAKSTGAQVNATAASAGCTIDTGNVYKRTSGSGYKYGTAGAKPRTTCGTLMVKMTQTSTLYKTVWWGLQQIAGPFTSTNAGQGTIQQTNVAVVCADLRDTTIRVIVRNTGTFPTGSTGTASAYEQALLPCGTNP